jgi:RNA-directed DNA polymerase
MRKVKRELAGRIYLIRYADDFVIGCTDGEDAQKVWGMLPDRLKQFSLELSPEKSRLIGFGRKAYLEEKKEGNRLGTFDFLGFTHYMTRSRKGGARLGRKTIGKRHRSTLIAMNDKLRKLRNLLSFRELHVHSCRGLKGYYNHYGFAGNAATLNKFAYSVERKWFKWLNRRSQRKSLNWEEFQERLKRSPLPRPRIKKGYSWIYAAGM